MISSHTLFSFCLLDNINYNFITFCLVYSFNIVINTCCHPSAWFFNPPGFPFLVFLLRFFFAPGILGFFYLNIVFELKLKIAP